VLSVSASVNDLRSLSTNSNVTLNKRKDTQLCWIPSLQLNCALVSVEEIVSALYRHDAESHRMDSLTCLQLFVQARFLWLPIEGQLQSSAD
jgi:hypothetical protein